MEFITLFARCLIAFAVLFSGQLFAKPTSMNRKWTIDDSLGFARYSRVVINSDKTYAAYISSTLKSGNSPNWATQLILENLKNKQVQIIDTGEIEQPRFSSNGKILAYIKRGNQVHLYDLKSKKNATWLKTTSPISSFKWSNDDKAILFTQNKKQAQTSLIKKSITDKKTTWRLALPYSINIYDNYYGGGFDENERAHQIAFTNIHQKNNIAPTTTNIIVYSTKTKTYKPIPYTENHDSNEPIYSPNGKWLAFRSRLPRHDNTLKLSQDLNLFNQVCITNTATFKTRCIENTPNRNPTILGWSNDSHSIIVFDGWHLTTTQLYALPINEKQPVKQLSNVKGFINPISLSFNNEILGFSYENTNQPPEPFYSMLSPFKLIPLNNSLLPQAHWRSKEIHWRSTDGRQIEGLLFLPKHYNPKQIYPLLTAIHGGPAGAWSHRYIGGCWGYGKMIMPICWGAMISDGFIVFQPNPRGSTNYGQGFRLANVGDLGGNDYRDVISGINHLIKKSIADPKHMALFGWSYGGYLTAWTLTQDQRFKAAVEGAGLTDLISFTHTTDIPYYLPNYLGKTYWKDPILYWQRSPLSHANHIKTPLLIINGSNDVRVPPGQSQELANALKQQNKTVKWLELPEQHHAPSSAKQIIRSAKAVKTWLDKALAKQ